MKSEPGAYAWADLVRDGRTDWTGVRNYQARAHLAAMRAGDLVFFYESVSTKAVLGLAEVTRTAFPDATASGADAQRGWIAVELRALRALPQLVTLAQIKAEPSLAEIALIRQSRLSVMPLGAADFAKIEQLGGAKV
nr:EVE domain-containing protein [Cephaloticoccus primus]